MTSSAGTRSRAAVPDTSRTADDTVIRRPRGLVARVGPERAGKILRTSQVAMAFQALGDRWSVLVLRDIFLGVNRFDDLVATTGASRMTLTNRLRSLVSEGILHRHPYTLRPTRYEYRLTRMGAALYPTALMYWLWEKQHGGMPAVPPQLHHRACRHAMLPALVCRHCRQAIQIGNILAEVVAEGDERMVAAPRHYCLHVGSKSWRGAKPREVHIIDVVGDRWTALVQAAAYFGLDRYADMQSVLEIPTNTLADRLRLLLQAGVLQRSPYQSRPVRHAYSLTEKGRGLYLSAFTLHQWADRWLLRGRVGPLALRHRSCGELADACVVCDHCGHELHMSEVEARREDGKPWAPPALRGGRRAAEA